MVVQRNAVVVAEHVQFVAHSRQYAASHLDRADITGIRPPVDAVRLQALAKDPEVEHRIVCQQHAAGHQRLDDRPEFSEVGLAPDRLLIDAGQLNVEGVERLFRVHQRVELLDHFPVFYDRNANGTHPVVPSVRRFHVECYESRHCHPFFLISLQKNRLSRAGPSKTFHSLRSSKSAQCLS